VYVHACVHVGCGRVSVRFKGCVSIVKFPSSLEMAKAVSCAVTRTAARWQRILKSKLFSMEKRTVYRLSRSSISN
jgi:hypothetical protein